MPWCTLFSRLHILLTFCLQALPLPAGPGHEPVVFVGRTDGRIVPARGPPDFG